MLAYYNISQPACQVFFETFFDFFNLAPLNLSFSRVFGLFCTHIEVAIHIFRNQNRHFAKKQRLGFGNCAIKNPLSVTMIVVTERASCTKKWDDRHEAARYHPIAYLKSRSYDSPSGKAHGTRRHEPRNPDSVRRSHPGAWSSPARMLLRAP